IHSILQPRRPRQPAAPGRQSRRLLAAGLGPRAQLRHHPVRLHPHPPRHPSLSRLSRARSCCEHTLLGSLL
ncbi:hypothetical protein HK405_000467, partial [Cladochytrium tenue]